MPEPVSAFDCSNYQPADLGALIAQFKPEHVVVRLGLPFEKAGLIAHSLAQIGSVLSHGLSVGAYFWGYGGEDGGLSVRWALQVLDAARATVPILWADLEDQSDPPGPAWMRAAIGEAKAQGIRLGVYTRLEWIRDHFPGGEDAFAEFAGRVELWLAGYDGRAELDLALPKGFTRLWGKQYTDDPLDLDVFAPEAAGLADGGTMPSADVTELDQFNPSNYDTRAEYVAIDGAACSAASLAAVLNHYGIAANISEGLRRIRATGDDVTANLGLLNLLGQGEGIASALDAAGIPSSTHPWAELTRTEFREVLDSGRPIICQMHDYLGRGIGHFLVADGLLADGSGITVADSNAGSGKRFSYRWPTFWGEMAGGVAVWPDSAPAVIPPPSGVNGDGEDMGQISDLTAQVADLTAKNNSLVGAVAYLADDLSDRVTALASTDLQQQAQAIANEAQRVRQQFVGPRPAKG